MKNKIKIFKYPIGATILYSKSKSHFTEYQIGYKIDTLSEPPGLAHLVEHLIAMDHEPKLEKQTFKKQEQNGIISNALTDDSFVTLYANVNDKNIESALSIDSDRLFNRKFDDNKIEIEKKVVVQEGKDLFSGSNNIFEDEEDDNYNLSEDFDNALTKYLGIDKNLDALVGNYEKIRKYKKSTILKFIDRNFKPENMVFAINTALPFEQVKNYFEEYFLNRFENVKLDNVNSYSQKDGIEELNTNKAKVIGNFYHQNHIPDLRTVVIELIFPTFENIRENLAFEHIDSVLFEGLNSRMLKALRGKGLIYSCSTSKNIIDKDLLITGIETSTNNKNVNLVIDIIGETIKDLVENGITDEEFEIFKNRIKYEKERAKDNPTSADTMTLLLHYQLDIIDYYNFNSLKFAEKLTKDDINNYLVNLFKDNNIFVKIEGNYYPNKIYSLKEIENILGAKKSRSLLYSPAKLFVQPNGEEFFDYDYSIKHKRKLLNDKNNGRMGVYYSNHIDDKLSRSINKIYSNLLKHCKQIEITNKSQEDSNDLKEK